jgi:hypothetical protein
MATIARKNVQLFGKLVNRHGQPSGGVGIALLETARPSAKAQTLATGISDSNGLFVISANFPEKVDTETYALQISTSKDLVDLPDLKGNLSEVIPGKLYGPLTLVASDEVSAPTRATTHHSVLLAPEKEILEAVKRDSGLFFRSLPARTPDPCSPYSPPGMPSRVFRYSGLVRFSTVHEKTSPPPPTDLPMGRRAYYGFLSEVDQSWYDLGLGLGSLLYSVPLAPCEETKFAIVDWRRKDWARRTSAVDESHFQDTTVTRDEFVGETANMTSEKNANGTTSTFGYGLSLGPFTMGVGFTASTAHEDVQSDVATTRTVNDRTRMASQTLRSTRAFAIVEATQEEESVVRTRVLRNHNHCHTITFQYFEVLQHYLVATKERRRRPVLYSWAPFWIETFTIEEVAKWAYLLRRALLDPTLEPALDKVMGIATASSAEQEAIEGTGNAKQKTKVNKIEVSVTSATRDIHDLQLSLLLNGKECHLADSNTTSIPYIYEFDKLFGGDLPPLEDITRISIKNHDISIPGPFSLYDVLIKAETLPPASTVPVTIELAYWEDVDLGGQRVATKRLKENVERSVPTTVIEAGSDFQIRRLLQHLTAHRFHYLAAIWAGMDPGERMFLLDEIKIDKKPILDLVENTVVGADGMYVAYPLRDPLLLPEQYWGVEGSTPEEKKDRYLKSLENPSTQVDERLIVLPTPGIFAESQLGACSACEKIDETRFWNWKESPCPDQAPDITAAMLGSRYQAPTGLEFVTPGLTPEKILFPELPKPMIEIGDATLANLTKGLQLQDPKAVTDFVASLASASAENYRATIEAIVKLLPLLTGKAPPAQPATGGATTPTEGILSGSTSASALTPIS